MPFGLKDRGVIAPGRRADVVLIDSLDHCGVQKVFSAGRLVDDALFASRGKVQPVGLGSMKAARVTASDFAVPAGGPTAR